MGRHGLAKKTWSSYATAERLLYQFHKHHHKPLHLPISEGTTLEFIHWLATSRKLKAGTINSYLAGVRQLHISKGLPEPNIRTDTVNLILRGLKNKNAIDGRQKQKTRRPITKEIMAILKRRLRSWDESKANQRLIWAVATNLFHGAFRIGELLSNKTSEFDPNFELTTDDVHTTPTENQFRLKAPKEDRKGRSSIVDVYTTGGPSCPVHALQEWRKLNNHWPERQPAFRWTSGKPLTQSQFRKILGHRLAGYVENPEDIFCTHSFRIGAASMLGALGYGDEDIQAVGRWSSRAFEEYLLLPRTKRMHVAKQMHLN
jgi:integrase